MPGRKKKNPKRFEIWMEGYRATGEWGGAQRIDTNQFTGGPGVEAETFDEAVEILAKQNPELGIEPFTRESFTTEEAWKNRRSNWKVWGCALFDNETDARKAFG